MTDADDDRGDKDRQPSDTDGEPGDEDRRSGWGDRPWWEDRALQRARLRSQVELIVRSLPDVGVYPPGGPDQYGDMQFMYRQGVILVRDSDLERVREVLGGPTRTEFILSRPCATAY